MKYPDIATLSSNKARKLFTPEIQAKIDEAAKNYEFAEEFKENVLTYLSVLQLGKWTMNDYIRAVKYVSARLMGCTRHDSYAMANPDRFQRMLDEGKSKEYVDGVVSAYNGGKLVNAIMEQTLVPSYVLNAPLHQEALNTLAEVIRDERTKPMTRVKACEAILNYTKQPEVIRNEVSVDMGGDTVEQLRSVTQSLSELLHRGLDKGLTLREIAEHKLIDVTPGEEDE